MSTFIQYTADGNNGLFNVPFPYISRTHVKVMVNGYVQTDDGHYDWLNASTISFRPAYIPQAGALVEIRRETPMNEQLVQFQNGAVLTEEELNLAVKQLLFITQELKDRYEARLEDGLSRLSNGQHTTPEQIINAMIQEVLSSELLADLQARIGDIDLNAQSILEQHNRLNTLQATVDALAEIDGTGIVTFIENERTERIEADEAFASTLALIGAKSPDGLSFILNTNTTKVSPTETLATRLNQLQAAINTNEDHIADVQADLVTEQTARATADTALANQITNLSSTVVNNYNTLNAAILNEQTARANQDTALANQITQLAARVDTNEDGIEDVRADVLAEQVARADADTALANTLALLGAKNAQGSAFILNTGTVMVDASTSLATRLSGIEAKADRVRTFRQTIAPSDPQVGDIWFDTDGTPANRAYRWNGSSWQSIDNADIAANKAAILEEQTVRANADSALASSITTLQSTVNGHTASLQTHQSVINGLAAQWMVKTDVNGRVAGIGLYNTGVTSEFTVLADRFAIVHPDQGLNTPMVPFVVSGGVVYMQNVVIQDALIQNLTVSKLTNGILNADMKLGTGKIVFDNGIVMLVYGVGFGTANQFIEWFGPKLSDISLCSEANAYVYKKTNGDAYFGGSLHAGVLRNSVTGTDISDTAMAILGPFGTNGTSKVVNVSYTFEHDHSWAIGVNGNNFTPINPPTAQLVIERSVDGGENWTPLTTLNVTGTVSYTPSLNASEPGSYIAQMSGSTTYTDHTTFMSDYMYRARVVSRNVTIRVGGYWANTSQRITIVSTEG